EVTRPDRHANDLPRRTRAAQTQERAWQQRIAHRLKRTRSAGTWLPRAEELAVARRLTPFDKHILLFLTAITIPSAFQRAVECRHGSAEVGMLLHLFWDILEEQITARRHFYREAPLVREALIDLYSTPFQDDFIRSDVRIDRRMVDYLVGLESETT